MCRVLFYNGHIWRQCGKLYNWIVFNELSGLVEECGTGSPPNTGFANKYDIKQQWIFPGFHDSHLHIGMTGFYANEKFNLNLPESIDQFKKRLKDMVDNLPNFDEWLVGCGWNNQLMGRMPTIDDVDSVASCVPVVLFHVSYHICIVNSVVLSIIGITKTSHTNNNYVSKFDSSHKKAGEPNGVLLEDPGMKLVLECMPELSSKQKEDNVLAALHNCLKQGLTSVHTCEDGYWNEYVNLAKKSMLPIYCYFSPYSSNMKSSNFPSKPKESYDNLSCDIVKVFIDGALGSETAALSLPYVKTVDGEKNFGVLQKSLEEFKELFATINNAGFRLEIHVIGDRAAEIALNLLEDCGISPTSRPIFVHCQILRQDLLDQMLIKGVVSTIQPSFVPTDAKSVEKILPLQLQKCMYPWKTLLNKGIVCGGSSDSPVETTNPLQGIYDAIYRLKPDGTPLVQSECLSFKEAVNLYTTGSAFADFAENSKGQLEVGFQADIVILDVPLTTEGVPFNLPQNPKILKKTTAQEVWIKGKRIWQKEL